MDLQFWPHRFNPDSPHGIGWRHLSSAPRRPNRCCAEQRLSAERERFVQLFDQAPTFLAVLRGADHVIELANPGYVRLIGDRSVVGRRFAEALPEAVEQGFLALLDEVYRTGKPFAAFGAKYIVQASPEGPIDERYVDFVYEPVTDRDGSVSGILVEGVDVTGRAVADRALSLDCGATGLRDSLSGVGINCDLPFNELQWDEAGKGSFFLPAL